MYRRFTFTMPAEWFEALSLEANDAGKSVSDLVRSTIQRSLATRGHQVAKMTAAPGKYDRAAAGLLNAKNQMLHEKRMKNRARVRRQLERQRKVRQIAQFTPVFSFDRAGGVWTADAHEEVGWITSDGQLTITDSRHSEDAITAELRTAMRLHTDVAWQPFHYLLIGESPPATDD